MVLDEGKARDANPQRFCLVPERNFANIFLQNSGGQFLPVDFRWIACPRL